MFVNATCLPTGTRVDIYHFRSIQACPLVNLCIPFIYDCCTRNIMRTHERQLMCTSIQFNERVGVADIIHLPNFLLPSGPVTFEPFLFSSSCTK
jgi:hypothetical protein